MPAHLCLRHLAIAAAVFSLAACESQKPQPPSQAGPMPGGPGANGRPGKPPPSKPPSPEETLAKFDADRDGALSSQENLNAVLQEAQMRFTRIDRDRDGKLSSQELDEARNRREAMAARNGGSSKPAAAPQRPQSLLPQADADGDGAINAAEYQAAARRQAEMRFRMGDRDRDGRLTAAEMQAGPPNGRQQARG